MEEDEAHNGRIANLRQVEFVAGQVADVYEHGSSRVTVLLWHGSGPNERSVLSALATHVAAFADVVVPDWTPQVPSAGADLKASLELATSLGNPVVVGGWSLGATAAVARSWDAAAVRAVVGLPGDYGVPSPIEGVVPLEAALTDRPHCPVWLVHGTSDEVVPPGSSAELARRLRRLGAAVSLQTLDTDHAGIVLARYDSDLRACVPLPLSAVDAEAIVGVFREAAAAAAG